MLRRLLLYLSAAGWARRIATHWGLARRVALRFVAGETLDDAVEAARKLNQQGLLVTLNYLGESITRAEDTEAVVATYLALIEQIHTQHLRASVSVKPTHLGLDIGEDLCRDNLRQILLAAKSCGIPVTIDMEGSPHTDRTLRLYRTLRDEDDFSNVGTVIQAYLRRSEADMQQLAAEGSFIRLCKGAYLEPPDIAFPDKVEVDANYVRLVELYLTGSDHAYLCLATHDERMIQAVQKLIRQYTISPERYEFQMLLGVRSDRQAELAAAGEKMRIYVPYGEAWYPYFVRRLAERPANVWFFLRMLVGR
ncbi:MAG: proline dehydrogenase family protein [Anaerolineae bacterium]|nr:proline dehydrogenase family protein [Anaerolineae bacterium]